MPLIRRYLYILLLMAGLVPVVYAQQDSLPYGGESYSAFTDSVLQVLRQQQERSSFYDRLVKWKTRRDSIQANRNVLWTVLGGPSYTPETSWSIAAAVLLNFRINKSDTVSFRSYAPIAVVASLNGTFIVTGSLSLFLHENRMRLSAKYAYKKAPSHYFGRGLESIEHITKSDSTTKYRHQKMYFVPRVQVQMVPHLYGGVLADFTYVSADHFAPRIYEDEYFNRFAQSYRCVGYGVSLLYDTRNDLATATSGMMLSGLAKTYGTYIGSSYDYSVFELEYKHFVNVFRPRSTLAWTAKTQMSVGEVPYTELPYFGSSSDLRGFYGEKYRDKSMAYIMAEYRHMFGSPQSLQAGNIWSRFGFVVWGGMGTIAPDLTGWTRWRWNVGVGGRFMVQPNKNIRFDVGKGQGEKGFEFYMGMTEAF